MITKVNENAENANKNRSKFYLQEIDLSKTGPKEVALDKLAFQGTNDLENKKRFQRVAYRKAISKSLTNKLIGKSKKLKTSIRNTFFCSEKIIQQGVNYSTERCKNRWCPICQAHYKSKLILQYQNAINQMVDPYFLTLTFPAVRKKQLEPAIAKMKKAHYDIIKRLKTAAKRSGSTFEYNAIRKMESNYNAKAATYNPHFHILIDGKENAIMVRLEWLKIKGMNDQKLSPKAQELEKADKLTVAQELFKYLIKPEPLDKFSSASLVRIYEAFHRKHIIETFGNIKKAEVITDQTDHITIDWKNDQNTLWQWEHQVFDWITQDGEALTDFIPTEKEQTYIHTLINEPENEQ